MVYNDDFLTIQENKLTSKINLTLERTYSNNDFDNLCFYIVYRNIYHKLGVIDLVTRSPSKSCMVYKENFLKIQENKPTSEINLKLEGTYSKYNYDNSGF